MNAEVTFRGAVPETEARGTGAGRAEPGRGVRDVARSAAATGGTMESKKESSDEIRLIPHDAEASRPIANARRKWLSSASDRRIRP